MPFIEDAVEKFKFEVPEEIQLSCDTPEIIALLKEIEQVYNLELSPVIIFFVVGDLSLEEIPGYLENEYNLDETISKKIAEELEEKILEPLLERANFLNEHPDKEMTIEQEKIYIENIFKKKLLAELTYDPIIKAAVNDRLFFILARELDFNKKLEQAMYDNQEILTTTPIMVGGKEEKGTISNWLRDYIGRYGSQANDSVSMSAFLINSDNGKKLSADERGKLTDIIKIYINIKFFPESMPSDDGDDWQIIPYEVKEQPIPRAEILPGNKQTNILMSSNEKEEIKITPPFKKPEIKVITPTPVVKKDIPAPVKPVAASTKEADNQDIIELKNMLLQYPEGSLERAAIEEEIKTLQNK